MGRVAGATPVEGSREGVVHREGAAEGAQVTPQAQQQSPQPLKHAAAGATGAGKGTTAAGGEGSTTAAAGEGEGPQQLGPWAAVQLRMQEMWTMLQDAVHSYVKVWDRYGGGQLFRGATCASDFGGGLYYALCTTHCVLGTV